MKRFPALIGVIHLPPLAGSPDSHGLDAHEALEQAGTFAVEEATALAKAGFEGLIIENFGDSPFFKDHVPPETIASLAIITSAVRGEVRIPIGVNVLRNDSSAALAIAAVAGADFIRVNVLSGVAATDQGIIEGKAAELLRERARLHAPTAIFADVHVKHARSLSSDDIALAVEETSLRSKADAVIVTGETTARPVAAETLERASRAARGAGVPLYVGSGSTAENLSQIMEWADGVIVGSALRKGGRAAQPLDSKRVGEYVRAFRGLAGKRRTR